MKKKPFTLIELMAVILIIGILMGLVSVLIPQVRERGRRSSCANNLRQVGGIIESYAQDHELQYPFGAETSSFLNFLTLETVSPYVQGKIADLARCPSGRHADGYDMYTGTIAPNEVDSAFVSARDKDGNHLKPTYFHNVLFGDGSVKGFTGTKSAKAANLPELGPYSD